MKILNEYLVLNGTNVERVLECDMGNHSRAYFIIEGKNYTLITFKEFQKMYSKLKTYVIEWKKNNG